MPPVSQSLREYGRGIAGGLLFSLPLLYTGEIWEAGELHTPERLLVGLGGAFVVLLGYNRHAGLRCDASVVEVMIDSIEELGLGLLVAAAVLVLLGRIDLAMATPEIVGKVIIGGLAVAIGVSVGTAQLGGVSSDESGMIDDPGEGDGPRPADAEEPQDELTFIGHMALALCGAVLVAANIAPTEEIPEISATIGPWSLLVLTALTLGVGMLVLHFSDFVGTNRDRSALDVLVGSVASYFAAIVASATLLWFFGRFDGNEPAFCLAQVIVLGLPSAIGASAGRLLLQPS